MIRERIIDAVRMAILGFLLGLLSAMWMTLAALGWRRF